jgi:hypothetical protein
MKNEAITLQQAQEALTGIETRRAAIIGRRNELGGRVDAVEKSAGERYLAGDKNAPKELAEIRTEIDLCERALVVLDDQGSAAQVDLKRATAGDLRRQAGEKRMELDALRKKTGALLRQLSDLELAELPGVQYGQHILCAQRHGAYVQAQGGYIAPPDYFASWEVSIDPTNPQPFEMPRSYVLRGQIEKLEQDAAAIELELTATLGPSVDLQDAA